LFMLNDLRWQVVVSIVGHVMGCLCSMIWSDRWLCLLLAMSWIVYAQWFEVTGGCVYCWPCHGLFMLNDLRWQVVESIVGHVMGCLCSCGFRTISLAKSVTWYTEYLMYFFHCEETRRLVSIPSYYSKITWNSRN
jgi:uncharacterized membrane protein